MAAVAHDGGWMRASVRGEERRTGSSSEKGIYCGEWIGLNREVTLGVKDKVVEYSF
jgi:hypothetical protein